MELGWKKDREGQKKERKKGRTDMEDRWKGLVFKVWSQEFVWACRI